MAKKSIVEIKSIVEDCRSGVIGGLKTGLLLWNSCVSPFLIYNSSTWISMKESDMVALMRIEQSFFSTLLGVRNCPAMSLYWDLGAIVMPLKILKEKLLLYWHIHNLPSSSVAHQAITIQERLNFPSLRDEIVHFLNKYEVVDVTQFSKESWKVFVNKNITDMNRNYILEHSKKYKKIDYYSMGCEEFGLKDYFLNLSLADGRLKFRERCKTMSTCKTDYPSDINNIRSLFSCQHCDEIDSVRLHWKYCIAYSHLRENRNLNSDVDLCAYYRDIINMRNLDSS